MSFFVYIHTTPCNKKYIGVTIRKPEERWNNGKGYSGNRHFYSAIKKYGWENIKHDVFTTESKSLMLYWERILIYHHKTTNRKYGYNKTTGGEHMCGWNVSEETKKKISIASKGRKLKPLSEETKKKISEALKGRKLSEERKKKIGEGGKGRVHSEETKKKMSESAKGRTVSIESRRKMSEAKKGHRLSDEHKRKMLDGKKLYWENKRKQNT